MHRSLFLAVFLGTLSVCGAEKLLLVVLGGFRWDYFNIHAYDVPGFSRIFEEGVRAEYLTPSFPTLTYPNLYSISTGLYPENHGIVGDEMWDPDLERLFERDNKQEYTKPDWWEAGEPLWVTATRQGKTSYLLNWPACETVIRGYAPTHCDPLTEVSSNLNTDLKKFVSYKDTALELLANDTADFVGIYFDISEHATQIYSPNSAESKGVTRWLDNELERLHQEVTQREMEYDVNVLVASDHGMADISKKKTVNLTSVLLPDDVTRSTGHGAMISLWPAEGKEQEVYDKLKDFNENMAVYLKEDLPERWHYKNSVRVAPLTLVANLGWTIVTPTKRFPKKGKGKRFKSYQGFDNKEVKMRAIFFGFGPNLKRGYKLSGLDNVNLYQLMCRILRISAAPNNGTWSLLEEAFIKIPYRPLIQWRRTFTYGTVGAVALLAFIIYYVKCREPSEKHKEV